FGWDWALRMNTIGLNKTAKITFSKLGHVASKTTRIISVTDEKAIIEFDIVLSNCDLNEIEWSSDLFGKKIIKKKHDKFTRRVEIENPKRWWPRGHGDPFLYEDKIILKSKNQII